MLCQPVCEQVVAEMSRVQSYMRGLSSNLQQAEQLMAEMTQAQASPMLSDPEDWTLRPVLPRQQ